MSAYTAIRLHEAIRAAGVSIDGVSIGRIADPATYRVTPVERQAAAQPIIDAFDPSDAADLIYLDAQEPLLKDLRDQVVGALASIDTYLAIADTATAAQVRAEVKAIDQRQKKILQALARIVERSGR